MTKILGISCSLRNGSNSDMLLERAMEGSREAGAETAVLRVKGAQIAFCDGCGGCAKTGLCLIKDDMQEWSERFLEADGIIFATPVYFWTLPAQTKLVMDRLYPLYQMGALANKVGGVIATATALGHTGVWQLFNEFLSANHMIAADFVYAWAQRPNDVRRDKHAWIAAAELGKEVVGLAQTGFRYPAAYPRPVYIMVSRQHGVPLSPPEGRFDYGSGATVRTEPASPAKRYPAH